MKNKELSTAELEEMFLDGKPVTIDEMTAARLREEVQNRYAELTSRREADAAREKKCKEAVRLYAELEEPFAALESDLPALAGIADQINELAVEYMLKACRHNKDMDDLRTRIHSLNQTYNECEKPFMVSQSGDGSLYSAGGQVANIYDWQSDLQRACDSAVKSAWEKWELEIKNH